MDHVEREVFAGLLQHALRLLGLLQHVADLRQRRHLGDDAPPQQQADLVDHHQLAGIGDGDHQPPVLRLLQRHEVVAEHQVHFDLAEQFVLNVEVLQVHELAAVAARQVLRMRQLVSNGHVLPLPPFTKIDFLSAIMHP